jgi:hypothetical protein
VAALSAPDQIADRPAAADTRLATGNAGALSVRSAPAPASAGHTTVCPTPKRGREAAAEPALTGDTAIPYVYVYMQ